MRSSDPQSLRALAARIRREADHLVLVRLRVARDMSEAAGDQADDPVVHAVHDEWTREQYPALGTASRSLRRLSEQLSDAAESLERAHGRRMGGYRGAGYLGAGQEAAHRVRDVTEFFGTDSGARIGGYPLPAEPARPEPHASHTLGQPTPDYVED